MPARAPSLALLRALVPVAQPTSTATVPISSHCLRLNQQQTRSKTLWMPRKKYAKVTGLDKLHRRQREYKIKERQESETRAQSITFAPSPPPSPTDASSPSTPTPRSTSTTTSNPLFPPTPPSQPIRTPNPTPSTTPLQLPYLISRTPSLQLPVYEQVKGSGTKRETIIRKITGDVATLRQHVHEALGFVAQTYEDGKGRKKEFVRVNPVTRQVVIKGWRGAEVKKWLELGGF